MINPNFNIDKALSAILFIINKTENKQLDFHKLFKILYFAEQKHLVKYGRMIFGDDYIAMKHGAVPSIIYDILKKFPDYKPNSSRIELQNKLQVFKSNTAMVKALSQSDLDELSETDIKCLNESFEENINLSFNKITDKAHDFAWSKADINDEINILDIAKAYNADDNVLKYIELNLENQKELV